MDLGCGDTPNRAHGVVLLYMVVLGELGPHFLMRIWNFILVFNVDICTIGKHRYVLLCYGDMEAQHVAEKSLCIMISLGSMIGI